MHSGDTSDQIHKTEQARRTSDKGSGMISCKPETGVTVNLDSRIVREASSVFTRPSHPSNRRRETQYSKERENLCYAHN
jgi:hypothetical protein